MGKTARKGTECQVDQAAGPRDDRGDAISAPPSGRCSSIATLATLCSALLWAHRLALLPRQGSALPRPVPAVAVPRPASQRDARNLPRVPQIVEDMLACSAPCARLSTRDRAVVVGQLQGACTVTKDAGLCEMTPEQFCAANCGGGQRDMGLWLPDSFGETKVAAAGKHAAERLKVAFHAHLQCSARCASEGVFVEAWGSNATAKATDILRRCGVVHLIGAFELKLLDEVQQALDKLRSQKKKMAALLDRVQLHDSRFQMYLPFAPPFNSRAGMGLSDPVMAVLDAYLTGVAFGIDHLAVMTSHGPNNDQSLHPDNPSFMRLTMNVHTALHDIPASMGTTKFCPCTGEVKSEDMWVTNAAIKMAMLKNKDCLGESYAATFLSRGTVTIYDGATFHGGLANRGRRNRDVLKLDLGSAAFTVKRNYIQHAPRNAKKEVEKYRAAFGPPRFGLPYAGG